MAPEFVPLFACGILILATLLAWVACAVGFLERRGMRQRLESVSSLRNWVLRGMVLVATVLLFLTGLCANFIRQQFFLNEPMAVAAAQGDLEKVRTLLDRGASPDSWGVDFVRTAIVGAAANGHVDVVQLLLDRGANPDLRDSYNRSAPQRARDARHQEVVDLLVEAGAQE